MCDLFLQGGKHVIVFAVLKFWKKIHDFFFERTLKNVSQLYLSLLSEITV